MSVWVCITAKNEAESLPWLLPELEPYRVVLIDDGSDDGTGIVAAECGAYVIRHEQSQGIGPSLLEAWRYALEHGAERIVQMDAGGSHNPNEAMSLLLGGADVVIGSRFVYGGEYQGRPWRAWCSRFAAWMCNLAQGGKIRDWTSGYRVFTDKAARVLLEQRYDATMHAWQIEVLARARQHGLSVEERPICYVAGESSLKWSGVSEAIRIWLQVLNHMGVYR